MVGKEEIHSVYAKKFLKQLGKSDLKLQKKFMQRRKIFATGHKDKILNDHVLEGKWSGHNSINITGDFRAIYRVVQERPKTVQFVAFGTHSELYE